MTDTPTPHPVATEAELRAAYKTAEAAMDAAFVQSRPFKIMLDLQKVERDAFYAWVAVWRANGSKAPLHPACAVHQ